MPEVQPLTQETPQTPPPVDDIILKLEGIFKGKKHAALYTHRGPDPDAIGSMMAMAWLLERKWGVESTPIYIGEISHPQNVAMVNLLEPGLVQGKAAPATETFDVHVLVDTIPANAGLPEGVAVDFDLVVDHHSDSPPASFPGLFINLRAGSCCATVHDLILRAGLSLDASVDRDVSVATAILVGIYTDTENMLSDDCTDYEFHAWRSLFEVRDVSILKKLVNYERPKFWVDRISRACGGAVVSDGLAIVGLGQIPGRHRDLIAYMSQEMVGWEDVHTAVAFAIVGGSRMEGSIRSVNASVSVPSLAKDFAGSHGSGGGKMGKGAYSRDLAGGGLDDDDDDDIRTKICDLFAEREIKRIGRIFRS